MRNNSDWFKFNELRITDDIAENADKLLYPVYRISAPMTIYYQRRSNVEGCITLRAEERGTVGLSLATSSERSGGKFALEYGYRGGADFDGSEISGRLAAGQSVRLENLPANTSIALRYSGAVPYHDQTLKVSVAAERRTYLVPIRFLPRLPQQVAKALILLPGLGIALFLLSLSGYPWGFCAGILSPARYVGPGDGVSDV